MVDITGNLMGFINHIPNIFPPDIHHFSQGFAIFPRTWKRGLMAWQGLHQGAVKSRTKAQDSCGKGGKMGFLYHWIEILWDVTLNLLWDLGKAYLHICISTYYMYIYIIYIYINTSVNSRGTYLYIIWFESIGNFGRRGHFIVKKIRHPMNTPWMNYRMLRFY